MLVHTARGLPLAQVLVVLFLDHHNLHVDHGKEEICLCVLPHLNLQIGLESQRLGLESLFSSGGPILKFGYFLICVNTCTSVHAKQELAVYIRL